MTNLEILTEAIDILQRSAETRDHFNTLLQVRLNHSVAVQAVADAMSKVDECDRAIAIVSINLKQSIK